MNRCLKVSVPGSEKVFVREKNIIFNPWNIICVQYYITIQFLKYMCSMLTIQFMEYHVFNINHSIPGISYVNHSHDSIPRI